MMDVDSDNHVKPIPLLPKQNGEADQSAPPSYEEVMGQYQSSVCKDQQELPPLSYIDILPRCLEPGSVENKVPPKFEPFSEIVNSANIWLQHYPGVNVWRCETVERKVEKGPIIHLDSTLLHESTYGFNVYVIGLRLWLIIKPESNTPPQQLRVLNVVPKKKEVPISFRAGFIGGAAYMGGAYIMGPGFGGRCNAHVKSLITYEGLTKTLESVNNDLKETPIPGKILNIETSTVKFAESFKVGEIDPETTCWFEKGATTSKRFTQILRIFYIYGQPANEQICMHEVKPEMTQASEMNKRSKFQTFPELMIKIMGWLRSQNGIRILNLETRHARIHEFMCNTEIDSDSTDDLDSSFGDKRYLKFIRIFYTLASDFPSYANTMLTSRLFQPMRTGVKSFETMTETIRRVDAWLKVTGLPIFSVETVHYLYNGDLYIGLNPDRSDILIPQRSGKYWLTAIRLYFPTIYQEPSPLLLPPYIDWKLGESQTCSIT